MRSAGPGAKVMAQPSRQTLLVTSGDNPGRLRSEAAWAHLCGTAPIPASSGNVTPYRLNRGGDRQANRPAELAQARPLRCGSSRLGTETADGLGRFPRDRHGRREPSSMHEQHRLSASCPGRSPPAIRSNEKSRRPDMSEREIK